MRKYLLLCLAALFVSALASELVAGEAAGEKSGKKFVEIARFKCKEANQGVAVGPDHFYAVDNKTVGKYEKKTGKKVGEWVATAEYPALHFDGGVVLDGKLYLPHSNYPDSPMTSSVEVLDADTLKPISTHSIGVQLGSLTWIDRKDDKWWVVFANYNQTFGKNMQPYGNSFNTVFAQLNDEYKVERSWIFPEELIKRSLPMSISGGSWGPDGRLYVSGHDHPEVYVMRLPKMGSILELEETIPVGIAGQGIAWDRSEPGVFYGIVRKTREVVVFRLE